jgi:hypothetical protein
MKPVKITGKRIRTMAGRIIIGLVLSSLVGGLGALPAYARDFRPSPDRDRIERHHDRDSYYHRRDDRHYVPRRHVYAKPAVIIDLPAPPGFHIFLPSIVIR